MTWRSFNYQFILFRSSLSKHGTAQECHKTSAKGCYTLSISFGPTMRMEYHLKTKSEKHWRVRLYHFKLLDTKISSMSPIYLLWTFWNVLPPLSLGPFSRSRCRAGPTPSWVPSLDGPSGDQRGGATSCEGIWCLTRRVRHRSCLTSQNDGFVSE